MNLTRRHFEVLGDLIKKGRFESPQAKADHAIKMADFLGSNNAQFNRDRFLERCGV